MRWVFTKEQKIAFFVERKEYWLNHYQSMLKDDEYSQGRWTELAEFARERGIYRSTTRICQIAKLIKPILALAYKQINSEEAFRTMAEKHA